MPAPTPGADRAAARGAARAARPPRRRRDHQPGRDLRPGALQHERQRRGKPAVRHADRPRFRFRGAGRQSPTCRAVLDKVGLTEDLIEAGRQIAATMIEMFADLPPDHEFFEQFSFISAQDLPEFAAILSAADSGGVARRCDQDQRAKAAVAAVPADRGAPSARRARRGDAAAAARSAAGVPARPAGGGEGRRSSSSIPSATTPRPRCRTTSCSARSPMARPMRRCGFRR